MARVGRTRNRSNVYIGYNRKRLKDGSIYGPDYPVTITHTSTITDSKGRPIVPSPLNSTQRKGILRLNGSVWCPAAQLYYEFLDVPFQHGTGEVENTNPLPVPNGWVLDLVAGTNPSRPVVMPPTMIQDLITLPGLIRETGKLLSKPRKLWSPREAANGYLAAKFGWWPMIDDLLKLLDLQKHILKRNAELKKLYSGKGLRRRLKFNTDTKTYKQAHLIGLYQSATVTCPISVTVVKSQWATIHWKPTAPPPFHPMDEKWNQKTTRLVLGMTPEGMAKGLWDVIPWTWLLGWFTNIGKLTLAHSNTVPATWSEPCFMNKVEATFTAGGADATYCEQIQLSASGKRTYTTRSRAIGGGVALPGLNLPYLDGSRLSVLGALFAQRFMR